MEELSVVFVKHLPLANRNGVPYHHIFAKPKVEMLIGSFGHQGGGFVIGLERLLMVLFDADNICQIVAFPNLYMRSG